MSTYKQKFNKKYGFDKDESHDKEEISELTGIPILILNKVYDRGMGAWKTNPRSVRIKGSMKKNPDMRKYPRSKRLSKYAWGMARVYSFVMKGKTYKTADKDLANLVELLDKNGGDIGETIRRGINRGFENVKQTFKKGVEDIKSFFDSNKFNNVSKETLDKYGKDQIIKIDLYRTPLPSWYTIVGNIVSGEQFSTAVDKLGYDNLYHLAMVATVLHNGNKKKIILEKNEEINFSDKYDITKDTETINVPLDNQDLTIKSMVKNTKNLIGEYNFFHYNSFSTNCQHFILSMLKANGLNKPYLEEWLYQKLGEIKKTLPKLAQDVAQTAIEIKRTINRLTGKGINNNKFKKQLEEEGIDPNQYLLVAKYQAKIKGLNPDKLKFSNKKNKKLDYDGVSFGAVGYGDFLIYNFMEMLGNVDKGKAKEKRRLYRARAKKIYQNSDKFDASWLAWNILW